MLCSTQRDGDGDGERDREREGEKGREILCVREWERRKMNPDIFHTLHNPAKKKTRKLVVDQEWMFDLS